MINGWEILLASPLHLPEDLRFANDQDSSWDTSENIIVSDKLCEASDCRVIQIEMRSTRKGEPQIQSNEGANGPIGSDSFAGRIHIQGIFRQKYFAFDL
jgi:hypothetical protein